MEYFVVKTKPGNIYPVYDPVGHFRYKDGSYSKPFNHVIFDKNHDFYLGELQEKMGELAEMVDVDDALVVIDESTGNLTVNGWTQNLTEEELEYAKLVDVSPLDNKTPYEVLRIS